MRRLGINWQIGARSGWGTYGVNLCRELLLKGRRPVPLHVWPGMALPPDDQDLMRPALIEHQLFRRLSELHGPAPLPFPVLHAMADWLDMPDNAAEFPGAPDLGVAFFEHAAIPRENIERAGRLALIVAGSSWNANVLASLGLRNVAFCPQGIDPALFKPGPRHGAYPRRFVVFSGGKLEYRKGQDLLVKAFDIFRRRHPEALLVTAWHNPWAPSLATLARSPHVEGVPEIREGRIMVGDWLLRQGLPADSFVDLGPLPNHEVAGILREVDIAAFPNRCEGGTNLVAMECMACGVPAILSRNTGHLDLLAEAGASFSLDLQLPLDALTGDPALAGWGESAIDEIVEALETVHGDPAEAARRGRAAAAFMAGWSWSVQVDRLLAAVDRVC